MDYKDILLLVNVTATDDFYPTVIQYAREHGWRLTIEDRMAPPKGWHGDGAIVQAMDDPAVARYVRSLQRHGIPAVNLVNSKMSRRMPSCIIDVCTSCRLAANHFRERGFRHVAYFSMEWLYGRALQFDGLAKAWDGFPVRKWVWAEAAVAKAVNDRAAMAKWLKTILFKAPKPIAVLCSNSYNAVTLMNVCLDIGMSVPDEVAIMSGLYDPAFCDCQSIPISGILIDSRQHAMKAATMLDEIIETGDTEPRYVMIEPHGIAVKQSTDVIATENPYLRNALRFIRENISSSFGAAEIAEYLDIPRIRLDRLFAVELGRSVGAEITRQRIAKAKRLLSGTDMTLAAIAAETGFCHASYLISTFKKSVGKTPHKYRRGQEMKN